MRLQLVADGRGQLNRRLLSLGEGDPENVRLEVHRDRVGIGAGSRDQLDLLRARIGPYLCPSLAIAEFTQCAAWLNRNHRADTVGSRIGQAR